MLYILVVVVLGLFSLFSTVSAHEAYVMPYDTFWNGVHQTSNPSIFEALENPADIQVTAIIVVSVLLFLGLNFLFRLSKPGQKVHLFFEKFSRFGPHAVRISIAVSLFFSAWSGVFLGPELHGNLFAQSELIRGTLFVISFMILFGVMTELAAVVGIAIFISAFSVFGSYMLTYSNYLGEFIVLLLFGMRVFSVDKYLFGPLKRFHSLEKYETLIIRVMYGFALIYAAITVKLLHPDLTTSVVTTWNLTQFHWLFPSDPLLVAFGAGIVECVIGLFIIFGFEMRMTILISLFYITLSLLYFRELVWPHILLYGISFNLLVQPETFTLDHLFFGRKKGEKPWWKRPFLPHNKVGKSKSV